MAPSSCLDGAQCQVLIGTTAQDGGLQSVLFLYADECRSRPLPQLPAAFQVYACVKH